MSLFLASPWLPVLGICSTVAGYVMASPRTLLGGSVPPYPTTKLNATASGPSRQVYGSSAAAYAQSTMEAAACNYDCALFPFDVDIFYWPAPNADTSCLSIIGDSINPPSQGATTSTDRFGLVDVWWGCTVEDRVSGTSYITTATQIDVNNKGTNIKQSLFNPWSTEPCIKTSSSSTISSYQSPGFRKPYASLQARGHSLAVPLNITQNVPISTVIREGFTFTSPYIYASFYNITRLGDALFVNPTGGVFEPNCGNPTMTEMMLRFKPGELSTLLGGPPDWGDPANFNMKSKPLDTADFPCPPQEVAEENWYKPEPGEPYRPLIALPTQARAINPILENCASLLTAYDPPRTLVPATAMASDFTGSDPQPSVIAPTPGSLQDSGPIETASPNYSLTAVTVAQAENAPQPQQTTRPGSNLAPNGDVSNEFVPPETYQTSDTSGVPENVAVVSPSNVNEDPAQGADETSPYSSNETPVHRLESIQGIDPGSQDPTTTAPEDPQTTVPNQTPQPTDPEPSTNNQLNPGQEAYPNHDADPSSPDTPSSNQGPSGPTANSKQDTDPPVPEPSSTSQLSPGPIVNADQDTDPPTPEPSRTTQQNPGPIADANQSPDLTSLEQPSTTQEDAGIISPNQQADSTSPNPSSTTEKMPGNIADPNSESDIQSSQSGDTGQGADSTISSLISTNEGQPEQIAGAQQTADGTNSNPENPTGEGHGQPANPEPGPQSGAIGNTPPEQASLPNPNGSVSADMGTEQTVQPSPDIASQQTTKVLGSTIAPKPLAATKVVLGGITYALPTSLGALLQQPAPLSQQQQTPGELGDDLIMEASNGKFVIDSSTLDPGGTAITLSGTPVVLNSAGDLAVGSQTLWPGTSGLGSAKSVIDKAVLAGGPAVTVDATLIRFATSELLDIGSSTILISVAGAAPTAIAVGNQVLNPNSTAFAVDGITISAGGPGVAINSPPVSLKASSAFDVGSSTNVLSPINVYTVDNDIFTANSTAFSVDGGSGPAAGPTTVLTSSGNSTSSVGSSSSSMHTPEGSADASRSYLSSRLVLSTVIAPMLLVLLHV